MVSKPFQEFETVHAGHFQVRQNHVGDWEFFSVTVLTLALQVTDTLFGIVDAVNSMSEPALFGRYPNKVAVVLVVFD
jgi:hypothetical protein